MRSLQLLFETQQAAREVAFILRYQYDGCNMITLPPFYDTAALKTAIELIGVDFCFEGDHYPLVLPVREDDLIQSTNQHQAEQMMWKAELWCNEAP